MKTPLAVIGLGNPPREYDGTRHNVGMMAVEYIAQQEGVRFRPGKGRYFYGQNARYLLVIPTTYMNESGVAVRQVVDHFGLAPQDLLVVLDDVNLPFGTLRLRPRGSDGGHRGLASVLYHLATDEVPRLRIGVGRDPSVPLREYVLSPFTPEERAQLPEIFHRIYEGLEVLRTRGLDQAMNLLNRRKGV